MAQRLSAFKEAYSSYGEDLFASRYKNPFLVIYRQADAPEDPDSAFKTTAISISKVMGSVGEEDPEIFPLTDSGKGMITVGRTPNNAVVLKDPTISKFHAYFRQDVLSNAFTVADAGSVNGTKVNGTPLQKRVPRLLSGGEHIEFGDRFRAVFHTARTLFRLMSRSR